MRVLRCRLREVRMIEQSVDAAVLAAPSVMGLILGVSLLWRRFGSGEVYGYDFGLYWLGERYGLARWMRVFYGNGIWGCVMAGFGVVGVVAAAAVVFVGPGVG